MSSEWQLPRSPRFELALIPPEPAAGGTDGSSKLPHLPAAAPPEADIPPPAGWLSVSCSCGWTAVASSAQSPVSVAVVARESPELWPEKWLHPNERRRISRLYPPARRESLAAITAARRALAGAWQAPAPALSCFDLSPLLDGVQSVRLGDWTVQRIPAPAGVHAAAAAPGAGWTYSLKPLADPRGASRP